MVVVQWSAVLAIFSDNPSSSPDGVYSFYSVKVYWKEQNKPKKGRDDPFKQQEDSKNYVECSERKKEGRIGVRKLSGDLM